MPWPVLLALLEDSGMITKIDYSKTVAIWREYMLKTVFVSIGTSLLVSFITFILGLKSGKNQTDRVRLQNMYKQIYSHFHELEKGLEDERPKKWSDYKKIETKNTTKYYPPVQELESTGDILYIKKKISDEALSLERDCLVYAYRINSLVAELHKSIITNSQLYNGNLSYDTSSRKDDTRCCMSANPNNCNTYRSESYLVFFDENKLASVLQSWEKADKPYAIRFSGNSSERIFILYPGALKENSTYFLSELIPILKKDIPGYNEIAVEKEKLKIRIQDLNIKLIRRAKEPTSFWETVAGAFLDIFH